MLYLHFGYIIYRRGLRVVVPTQRQCEGPITWNDSCRVPRFFVPYSELIGIIDFGRIRWMIAIRIHIVSVCLNMSVSLLAGCLHLAMW